MHPVLLQVSPGRRLLSQPTPRSSLSPFFASAVTTPMIYEPTCSGNCCLNWSTQMIQVKAWPPVWPLKHWTRVQFHTWVCWQTGGKANHPAERQGWCHRIPCLPVAPEQHMWPAWTKVPQILLASGTNRVMQSHGFMTAELNTTDKAKVSKVSAVFLLKITFQLHIFLHPHHILLKATISTHMSRSQIPNTSYQKWVQIKDTASTWSKSSLPCFLS